MIYTFNNLQITLLINHANIFGAFVEGSGYRENGTPEWVNVVSFNLPNDRSQTLEDVFSDLIGMCLLATVSN